jgi:hypothetical protein
MAQSMAPSAERWLSGLRRTPGKWFWPKSPGSLNWTHPDISRLFRFRAFIFRTDWDRFGRIFGVAVSNGSIKRMIPHTT